jgi:hypothetical protein
MNVAADALPPKPNTAAASGAGTPTTTASFAAPLSYSAQVAEQFSSSYRQTPSQERGRLDAARLAQFNQMTGAPSGSTGASSTDEQFRPVRPSEMKDEGCVFPRLGLRSSSCCFRRVLYVKSKKRRMGNGGEGGCVPSHPTPGFSCAPDGHKSYRETVRRLLSGSVHAYQSRLSSPPACYMRLPDVVASFDGISQPHVLPLSFLFFYTVSLLLQDVKTYFCSPLCRFAMPTPTPILRSASPPLSLTSLPVLLATSLQQNVCRRLILGYNRWYFFPLPTHTRSLSLFAMSCPFC